MPKRKRENLDDLLALVLRRGESHTSWCARVDFPLRTLERLRVYGSRPRAGTVRSLAIAMHQLGGTLPDRIDRIARAVQPVGQRV